MDEIRKRMGLQSRVRVKVVDQQERAYEILSAMPEIEEAHIENSHISVTFKDGQQPDGLIARTLVNNNIDILALEPEQLKLDDAFLQLTKGIVH